MGLMKNSIATKLVGYFVWIVLIPVIVVSLITQNSYRNSVRQLAMESIQSSLDMIDENISQQFSHYEDLGYFISRDQQLQELPGVVASMTPTEQHQHWAQMRQLLNFYRTTVDSVERIDIAYDTGMRLSTDRDTGRTAAANQEEWYRKCMAEPDRTHVITHIPGERLYEDQEPLRSEMISVCRSMQDDSGQTVGVIHLMMYSQVLAEPMSNILNNSGSYVYVTGENGAVVYSPVVQTIPDYSDASRYCSASHYNEQNRWNIVGVMNMEAYTQQMETMSRIMTILLVAAVVLMGTASWAVGRSIVRPIAKLRSLMRKAEKGDLSVAFQVPAPVEIQELGDSFNHMLRQLNLSLQQVRDEQKAKRKAEIEALQANIKPHFLYNTLDTIHWMAKSYHAMDIIETVDALSTLFRIALSKGSETISVEQEILHVKSYLQIQKVRYEDMIQYDIHVTEECCAMKVQKLILQPLVENAIYHGIKESGLPGIIQIAVWRHGDSVVLMVADTGKGMSPQRLQEVRDSLQNFRPRKTGAYGIVNVHQRIALSYGPEYGITMESEAGIGTVAVIRHPILSEEEGHV